MKIIFESRLQSRPQNEQQAQVGKRLVIVSSILLSAFIYALMETRRISKSWSTKEQCRYFQTSNVHMSLLIALYCASEMICVQFKFTYENYQAKASCPTQIRRIYREHKQRISFCHSTVLQCVKFVSHCKTSYEIQSIAKSHALLHIRKFKIGCSCLWQTELCSTVYFAFTHSLY